MSSTTKWASFKLLITKQITFCLEACIKGVPVTTPTKFKTQQIMKIYCCYRNLLIVDREKERKKKTWQMFHTNGGFFPSLVNFPLCCRCKLFLECVPGCHTLEPPFVATRLTFLVLKCCFSRIQYRGNPHPLCVYRWHETQPGRWYSFPY